MNDAPAKIFANQIASELKLKFASVEAALTLLNEGSTIPFIARYRKEATGNLDEVEIKAIQDRFNYLTELQDRKHVILASVESQGKLTDTLKEQILNCISKTTLEDLYLPYKPKRRTRAMIAREKGLGPLADLLMMNVSDVSLENEALQYISDEKAVPDKEAALQGCRDIAAEIIAENLAVRAVIRETFASEGVVISKVHSKHANEQTKYEHYYDFKEAVKTIPSHRYLAIRRAEKENILDLSIRIETETVLLQIQKIVIKNGAVLSTHLKKAMEDSLKRLLLPSVETDVRLDLKMASDNSAVDIFADNLKNLLLASPLGARPVIGIDPGIRTGCKCAVIDETGAYLTSNTIFLSQGASSENQAKETLLGLIKKYHPYAIAIGNGTAGRETETFVKALLRDNQMKEPIVVSVNESGASIYSASDVAREEFPDLDLTIRGAISIARRLQDPLAELVKIDPKSIGVGQYQHDVHQQLLQNQLQYVVESCVNSVGVDVNTASAPLLSYVSGIGSSVAKKVVSYRQSHGAFKNRSQILKVPGLGVKSFEQCAGFLRILNGDNPLDSSAVHPERYSFVEMLAGDLGVPVSQLVGNASLVSKIDVNRYSNSIGAFTLTDIMQELKKPGRDPRSQFDPPTFRDDVQKIEDLKQGLRLEGIVTNVTAFGAFVDIGVHQDGLIHLSELSDRFIKHASEVVKTGDKISVEVLQVDVLRKRISLTARTGQRREGQTKHRESNPSKNNEKKPSSTKSFAFNPFQNF